MCTSSCTLRSLLVFYKHIIPCAMSDTSIDIETLQPVADEIMSKSGNIIGMGVNAQTDYVIEQEGLEGLHSIEDIMGELGYPYSFEDGNLGRFKMVPENYDVLRIYIAKKLFDWSDANIYEMGRNSLRLSQPLQVALGFISIERTSRNAARFWDKYFDFGTAKTQHVDADAGEWTVQLIGYDFHPIMIDYFRGYLTGVVALTEGVQDASVEHRACEHESGQHCDEYALTWESN